MSTLDAILARIEDSETAVSEKTAGASVAPATAADPSERLLETVRNLSKTASDTSTPSSAAIPALDKLAAETAAAESASLQKEARLAGKAFADAFMERVGEYNAAIPESKTASEDSLKAAYQKGVEDSEKRAAAAFDKGQEVAVAEIHKCAAEIHYAGQLSARNVLNALAKDA
jgi:hypothetical protein